MTSETAEQLTTEADQAANLGQYLEAMALFEKLLALDPTDGHAIYGKAYCYRLLDDVAGARQCIAELKESVGYQHVAYFEEGMLEEDAGRHEAALVAFDKALELDPGYENALVWTTTALRLMQRWEEAEQRSQQAVEAYPFSARLWVGRGWVFSDQKRYDEALVAFEQALQVEPGHEDALVWRTTAVRLLGRWEEAERWSQEAVEAHPDSAGLWVERGWVFSDQKRFEEAMVAFEKALEAGPSDESALLARVTCLRLSKRWEEAEQRSQEAVEAHPGSARAWVGRGWVFSDQKRYEDSLVPFEKALEIDGGFEDALVWRTTAVRLLERWEEAELWSQEAVEARPDRAGVWVERGWVLSDRKRYAEAMVAFEKALGVDPTHEDALLARVTSLRLSKRWEEAEQRSQEVVEAHPGSARVWVGRGWVFSDQKRYEEALVAFEKALQLDPVNEDAMVWRTTSVRLLERWEQAERWAQESVEAYPGVARMWVERGWVFSDQHRHEEALVDFEKALATDPTNDYALIARVTSLRLSKRWEEAEQRSLEAVEARPDSAGVWVERGWVFSDRKRYDEALVAFEKALGADPVNEFALIARVTCLRQSRRWEEAERRSQEALETLPHSTSLWVERGWVFLDQNRYDEARSAFERARATDPHDAEVDTGLGAVAFNQEKYSTAESLFRSSLALHPGGAFAYTNLAWAILRLDEDEKLDEVTRLCEKALSLDDTSYSAYSCLGVVAFRQGKMRLCESQLQKAVTMSGGDDGHTDLGAFYAKVGRHAEAEAELRKAIEVDWYDKRAHVELGALNEANKNHAEAYREFNAALQIAPLDSDAVQGLSLAQLELGEFHDAERILREALRQCDREAGYALWLLLSRVLIVRGDASQRTNFHKEALLAATEASLIRSHEALPYFYAGVARFKLGELTDGLQARLAYRASALRYFKQCLKHDPNNIEAVRNADLISQDIRRSQSSVLGGLLLAVVAVSVMTGLWVGFFVSTRVTSTMVISLTPILAGLVLLSFLLPSLARVKLPGLEADLKQDAGESVASGPTGGVEVGGSSSSIRTGPR